jgi:DNA-3-methyladenine glycosylase II
MQCFDSREDLERAVKSLATREPRFASVLKEHGTPSLRQAEAGLSGLLMIVTEQFLSLQAAAAIWSRVAAALDPVSAQTVLAASPDRLKSLGLSNAKIKSFHCIARNMVEGRLNFEVIATMDDESARATLVTLPGVGPWTAEIYLLSVLQRADAWPAGDLALQASVQDLLSLGERPSPKEMITLAEPWRPYRAAAARLLWSHYRGLKGLKQAGYGVMILSKLE